MFLCPGETDTSSVLLLLPCLDTANPQEHCEKEGMGNTFVMPSALYSSRTLATVTSVHLCSPAMLEAL